MNLPSHSTHLSSGQSVRPNPKACTGDDQNESTTDIKPAAQRYESNRAVIEVKAFHNPISPDKADATCLVPKKSNISPCWLGNNEKPLWFLSK